MEVVQSNSDSTRVDDIRQNRSKCCKHLQKSPVSKVKITQIRRKGSLWLLQIVMLILISMIGTARATEQAFEVKSFEMRQLTG